MNTTPRLPARQYIADAIVILALAFVALLWLASTP